MNTQEVLGAGVEACKDLTARFYPGFDEAGAVKQAPGLPNHLAWTLGHMAFFLNSVANELDGKGKPGAGFGAGGREAGMFEAEGISFKSIPEADASRYPTLPRSIEIFNGACDRLGAAVRGASDDQLSRAIKWGPGEIPLSAAVMRMIFHTGFHTGQIVDLRRALGMPRILG